MKVKVTRTGKYSIALDNAMRTNLWNQLVNFLESESAALLFVKLNSNPEVMRHLYANVLAELMQTKSFHLQAGWETKLLLSKSQVIALVWFLKSMDSNLDMLNLKSQLHQLL